MNVVGISRARADMASVSPTVRHSSPAEQTRGWADRRVKSKVFVAGLLLNLIASLVLTYAWEIGNGDGPARTANASYVLYSRDPHLAAIGFVWPMLPSLVQLPLLPLTRLLGQPDFAGYVMSAVSGAGVLVALSAILGTLGVTGWTRLGWLALVQFHPQFWYLAAAGVAEAPFMLCLALAVLALLHLPKTELALAALGMSLGAAFFVRYESIGLIGAFALVMLVLYRPAFRNDEDVEGQLVVRRRAPGRLLVQWWPRRRDWGVLEGRLLTVLAPPAYAAAFWLMMNWLIMGDPLYFQRSAYSLNGAMEIARNAGSEHPFYEAIGSPVLTVGWAAMRLSQANVALVVLLAVAAWLAFRRRDRMLLALVVLVSGMVAFTTTQIFIGGLPPMLRYWAYATPLAVILAGACVRAYRGSADGSPPSRSVGVFQHATTGVLLLGVLINGVAQGEETVGTDERRLAAHLRGDNETARSLAPDDFWWAVQHDSRQLAPVIDRISASGMTLIGGSDSGFGTILRLQHPERVAITNDRDYAQLLADPSAHLRYIAVAKPSFGGARDDVGVRFPDFYERGAPWAQLLGEVEDTTRAWRIYEVMAGPSVVRGDDGRMADELLALGLRPLRDAEVVSASDQAEAAGPLVPSGAVVAAATTAATTADPSADERPSLANGAAAADVAPISAASNDGLTSVASSSGPAAAQPTDQVVPAPDASRAATDVAPTAWPVLADASATQVAAPATPAATAAVTEAPPTAATLAAVATMTVLEPIETYAVRPGDTLMSIAAAHGTNAEILAEMNAVSDPSRVPEGTVLRVPRSTPADWVLVLVRVGDSLQVVYVPRSSERGR